MQKETMNIKDKSDNLLATVIRYSEITEGKNFITDNDSEFQLLEDICENAY